MDAGRRVQESFRSASEITVLLSRIREGDNQALNQLIRWSMTNSIASHDPPCAAIAISTPCNPPRY